MNQGAQLARAAAAEAQERGKEIARALQHAEWREEMAWRNVSRLQRILDDHGAEEFEGRAELKRDLVDLRTRARGESASLVELVKAILWPSPIVPVTVVAS